MSKFWRLGTVRKPNNRFILTTTTNDHHVQKKSGIEILSWGKLSFNINQDILWSKVALMITVFKTIETIGGEIYFVSIIFTGRQHFTKTYQKNDTFCDFYEF